MKKLLVFLLFLIMSINIFIAECYPDGRILINCQNGGGWVFILSQDGSSCEAWGTFKGRAIIIPKGTYTMAFDHGDIEGYNDGFPRPEAEYHIVEVKDEEITTVDVKMVFK